MQNACICHCIAMMDVHMYGTSWKKLVDNGHIFNYVQVYYIRIRARAFLDFAMSRTCTYYACTNVRSRKTYGSC